VGAVGAGKVPQKTKKGVESGTKGTLEVWGGWFLRLVGEVGGVVSCGQQLICWGPLTVSDSFVLPPLTQ